MEDNTADIRFGENSAQRAQEQRTLILAEIKANPNHVWAGSYYMGDGKGVKSRSWLHHSMGTYFNGEDASGCMIGTLVASNCLEIIFDCPAFPNLREGFRGIAEELLPIYWGDRTYLVPTDEIVRFYNDINSGAEPRKGNHHQKYDCKRSGQIVANCLSRRLG